MACIIRKAVEQDVQFLSECIKRGHVVNDHEYDFYEWKDLLTDLGIVKPDVSDFNLIKVYLNPKNPRQDLFVVNNGTKDIGFFSQDIDEVNMFLGGSTYVHPASCKMSILKVLKACVIRGYLYGVSENFTAVDFNIADPLVSSIARTILPPLKEYRLRDDYRVLFSDFSNIKDRIDYDSFVTFFKENYSLSIYDNANKLFSFNDKPVSKKIGE